MNTELQQVAITQDLQDLEIETFTVEELTELDQNVAELASLSLCSSTTTTSSSCG
jgi:thiazolylpeptide-type bacteriocin precursor